MSTPGAEPQPRAAAPKPFLSADTDALGQLRAPAAAEPTTAAPAARPIDRRPLTRAEQHGRDQAAAAIEKKHHLHSITAQCLAARGFSPGAALDRYLHPSLERELGDLWRLKNLEPACDRLAEAVRQGRPIVVCHDYDVDGTMSAAMTVRFLRGCGAAAVHCGSRRFSGGYGITTARVEELARAHPGALLLFMDFGTAACAQAARARELGLEVVIIDHHEPPHGEGAPGVLVNPKQPGCGFAGGTLCTGGLTCLLLVGLAQKLGVDLDLRSYLPYALFATIADVVPLSGLNRALCRAGLFEARRSAHQGVQELRRISGKPRGKLRGEEVAFGIGPRINAAGRLNDRGADLIVDLATTDEHQEARRLALEVNADNADRRRIEQRGLAAALAQAERLIRDRGGRLPAALVLADESIHAGVAGIIAARVKDRFNRPVFVFTRDGDQGAWVGSGRGLEVEGVSISAALSDARVRRHHEKEGAKAGGHAKAGGATILAHDLAAFAADFEAVIAEQLRGRDITPWVKYDAAVTIGELNRAGARLLDECYDVFEPCGAENPPPRLLIRGVTVTAVRPAAEGRHLLARLREDAPAEGQASAEFMDAMLWFNPRHPCLQPGRRVDLVVELTRDDRGAEFHPARQRIKLNIVTAEPAKKS